ncbi:hypothetical protein B0J11DRAFT_610943 [Dendryphion nanum]|uniref:Uncharacterized protein n=1 Tax=Dendryphion nanum TaxID=256645 RepID=A0A9P9EBL1_9PLEO|nr:hypothetical protein B0J11DRAFT_610943 [Dendryphion nanum]
MPPRARSVTRSKGAGSSKALRNMSAQPVLTRVASIQKNCTPSKTRRASKTTMDMLKNVTTDVEAAVPTITPSGEVSILPPPFTGAIESHRDAYGSFYAYRSTMGMWMHATALLAAGVIDLATAKQLSTPWQKKGELALKLDDKYMDAGLADKDVEIWNMERAAKSLRRKDKKAEEWLKDWRAGRIDDWGIPVVGAEEKGKGKEEMIALGGSSEETDQEDLEDEMNVPVPAAIHNPQTGPRPVSPKQKKPSQIILTSRRISKITPTTQKASGSANILIAVSPTPRQRDYKQYSYYQLVALCRKRSLASGGRVEVVRVRLMEDDRLTEAGEERKEVIKRSEKKGREFKTMAPIIQ